MFWDNVEPLRIKSGINKVQLSREIGKGDSQVRVWMDRNTIPPADYAVKIARYFGTTVEALVNDKGMDDQSLESHSSGRDSGIYPRNIQKLIDTALKLPSEKIDVLIGVADGFLLTRLQQITVRMQGDTVLSLNYLPNI